MSKTKHEHATPYTYCLTRGTIQYLVYTYHTQLAETREVSTKSPVSQLTAYFFTLSKNRNRARTHCLLNAECEMNQLVGCGQTQ